MLRWIITGTARDPSHRREHLVGEVLGVAGQLVQLAFAHRRRHHVLISGAPLAFVHVLLDGVPGRRAGRQPDRQAGAGQRVGAEQLQLAAQLAVVDHDGLLQGVYGLGTVPWNALRPGATAPGLDRRVCQRGPSPG